MKNTLAYKIGKEFNLSFIRDFEKKSNKNTKNKTSNKTSNNGEDLVRNDLIRLNIPFTEQESIQIPKDVQHLYHQKSNLRPDFTIFVNGQKHFIEVKYQNVQGTTIEKIPGTIRKYKHLNTPVIIVFQGVFFDEKFIETEQYNIKLDGLENMFHLVSGKDLFTFLSSIVDAPSIAA